MQQIQHKNVVALVDYIEDATFPQEHEVCFITHRIGKILNERSRFPVL